MTQRLFVAVRPPEAAREHLAEFLEPRPELPWIGPEQWHLTLAFSEGVAEYRVDELADRLRDAAARYRPAELRLAAGGVFPSVERARVIWAGVDDPAGTLDRLAVNARSAVAAVGGAPDGRAFRAHLTLARLRRPVEATRWLRILDTYAGPSWTAGEVEVVASHLGEGPGRRPRHEVLARVELGADGGDFEESTVARSGVAGVGGWS